VTREAHELAIQEWVETVLQGLSAGYEAIFSHQSAPHPSRPYASISMLSDVATAMPDIVVSDTPGIVDPNKVQTTLQSDRRVTFSVSIFGDDARAHARQLELSLDDDAVGTIFNDGGIQVRQAIGSTADEHSLRGASWDNFAAVDFEAGFIATRTIENAFIEDARVTSTGGDMDGFDLLVES
jgi:hypothetical protein